MEGKELIRKIEKHNTIIIYGAQKIAVATALFLNALKKDFSVIVTSKVGNPDTILGHQVYEVEDMLDVCKRNDTFILIAARKYQSDIERLLKEKEIDNYERVVYDVFRMQEIPYQEVLSQREYALWKQLIKDNTVTNEEIAFFLGKSDYKLTIDVQIVGNCNLNCQSCNVFSPLVDSEFVDVKEYENDLRRMANLGGKQKIQRLTLIGGEPLLHPNIIELINISREIFPDIDINIFTNGILLLEKGKEFFDACKKSNVNITYTKYPIDLDYNEVKKKLDKYGIEYRIFNGETEKKESHKVPIVLEGDLDKKKNFALCHRAGFCELKKGKLYACSLAPSYHRFFDYFGIDAMWGDTDGVDIYKCKSWTEMMEQLHTPMESCRYCNVCKTQYGISWKTSNRQITEWI